MRVIGAISDQLSGITNDSYRPFSEYLEQEIPGERFQVVSYQTVEDLRSAVDEGRVDFVLLTPAAYTQLAQYRNARILATVTQLIDGNVYPWLAGVAFVLDERDYLQELRDAAGRSVITIAPSALGSWLSLLGEWQELGMEQDSFSSVTYNFSYDEVLAQVCSGAQEIGAMTAGVFHDIRSRCDQPLRVLENPNYTQDLRFPFDHSTPLYPGIAFAAVNNFLGEDLIVSLTQALLKVESGSEVTDAISVGGFTAPLSYEPVEQLMQRIRFGAFENYGQFTVEAFLMQHTGMVFLALLLFLVVLTMAFARAQLLNRKLKQSEHYRRLLFEKTSLPLAIMSRNSLTITDMNEAAVKVYGYQSREQLLGKSPLDVSARVQKNGLASEEMIRNINMSLPDDQATTFEWLHQRPDGSTWDADVHLLPFTFEDHKLVHVTLVDVSERNRILEDREKMEQQLRHAQRLESLGRLSGAIAHDFNNLLTVINGYSELLLMNMNSADASYRTVMEIAQAGWRARELTNQLLTFGRRRISSVKPFDVNAMIMESGNMFRSLLGENIDLQSTLDASIKLTLADSSQLNQVLINMLVNAKDAMPEGGRCHITTNQQNIDPGSAGSMGIEPGSYVVVSVTDTGSGMSEEVQEHIFEPFFSTKADKGSGIGLATAYGIIRQSGGTITFVSEEGVGTTFTIYLPVTDRVTDELPDTEESFADLHASKAYTILIAEDQPDVRAYACSVLRTAGYRVLEADSGISALEIVEQNGGRLDLLFTDVVMPGMNGRELAERMTESWPAVKILFTSGYADDEVALHGVAQERIMFISKPYVPQHLLNKIKAVLS